MPFSIGMRVGRYELLARLGEGGMGEVWRARDQDLRREVAIKFLSEPFTSDAARMTRFSQEARAASSLNHPNIVTIHEIGEATGLPFIVMELVEGETLHELLRRGRPLPSGRVLEIGAQIADGLTKAHGAGIVHRDLKPENVMVTADGFAKILDFGLAKLRGEGASDDQAGVSSGASTWPALQTQTAAGALVGTVGYMSPEQAQCRPIDYRSDQFALGAILYELATGQPAFRRASPAQTLAAIIEDAPEPITALRPSFPAEVSRVIEKRCLAKDPAERYAATTDLARELRGLLPAKTSAAIARAGARRRFLTRWVVPLAAAVAVVIGAPWLRSWTPQWLSAMLGRPSLPAEKRIAVLPFRVSAPDSEAQALATGLMDLVTVRLAQLEGAQRQLWVEPAGHVLQTGIRDASRAARVLNANLVVTGSVQRLHGQLVLTAALEDAERVRTLHAVSASDVDALVDAIVGMLQLELSDETRTALKATSTGVAEAATLTAEGVGYRAYTEGRNALERYDQGKQVERAIHLFNRALERDPRYALAEAGLAEAYWRLYAATRKPEYVPLAREHCRRALELDDLLAWPWITLGMIESGTGNGERALAAFRKAIERDPRSADAYRELGAAFEKLGRLADAEKILRKAIELRPQSWAAYGYLARFLFRQGRLTESERAFDRALELAPDNAVLWYSIGGVRYMDGRKDAARQAFERSLALSPTPQAASNLATLQFSLGEYTQSARTLERATAIGTRDYRVWRNLASAYYWIPGERGKAAAAYLHAAELARQELELDPENPETLIELADCYAMTGQAARARAAARRALAKSPRAPTLALAAAQLYEELGEREDALRWLEVALRGGFPLREVEGTLTLAELRKDRRYLRLAQSVPGTEPKAGSK